MLLLNPKKEITKNNDCGYADKKKKPGEHEGKVLRLKFLWEKNDWNKKSSGDYHYVE